MRALLASQLASDWLILALVLFSVNIGATCYVRKGRVVFAHFALNFYRYRKTIEITDSATIDRCLCNYFFSPAYSYGLRP